MQRSIILQSIAKPYFQSGNEFKIGADYYKTIYVFNPGPWATRKPTIEFASSANVELVDSSGGVTWLPKTNKTSAFADEGLPPGTAFFITFKYQRGTNGDPTPSLFCDAKQCKNAPSSLDLDLILALIRLALCAFVLGVMILIVLLVSTKHDLKSAKEDIDKANDGIVHKALAELLNLAVKTEGEADVEESARALNALSKSAKDVRAKNVPRNKLPQGQPGPKNSAA